MSLKSTNDSHSAEPMTESEETGVSLSPFEKVLEDVGSGGRYQKFLIYGFMIPLTAMSGMGSSNTILLLTTPEHSCHVPGRLNAPNISLEMWKNMTIPWEEDVTHGKQRSSCLMYNISGQEILNIWNDNKVDDFDTYNIPIVNRTLIKCQHGWDFDKSSWQETPVSQFEWVCDDKDLVTNLFSLTYAGNAVGTLLFSLLSDRWGRKNVFIIVLLLSVIASVSSIFATSYTVYSIFRFILGLPYFSLFQSSYIIVVELCNEHLRNSTAIATFVAFVFGTCIIPVAAYLSGHWKLYTLMCHLPVLIMLPFFWLLCESPRWLLSQSRVDECEDILKRVARINGKSYTDRTRKFLLETQKEETKKGSLKHIFTSWILAKHLVLTSITLSIGYIYFSGVTLNIHNMTGSKIRKFLILSMVGIPGDVMGSFASRYLGRRFSVVLLNVLTGLCCLMAAYVIADEVALITISALAKLFTAALCLIVYVQVGELFPTSLRATAYGVVSVIGIAVTIFIPPLIAIGGSNIFLPYYILFGIGLFGMVVGSFLPETLGKPLPQTVTDAVNIGKNQPFFSVIHKWNVHKYQERQGDKYQERQTDKSRISLKDCDE